jgi:uncharacterized protein (UPF0548 family)
MRIVLRRWPTLADGNRYLHRTPTSDREGPLEGRVDTYKRLLQRRPHESTRSAFERARRRLFDYDIFSPKLVGYRIIPTGGVQLGCTIVQRLGFGAIFLESATRVIDVWDTAGSDQTRRAGFAYVTLQGHPECGVATFEARQEGDSVCVVLTARSVPGTTITSVGGPLTRLVQRLITRQAMRRMAASA